MSLQKVRLCLFSLKPKLMEVCQIRHTSLCKKRLVAERRKLYFSL